MNVIILLYCDFHYCILLFRFLCLFPNSPRLHNRTVIPDAELMNITKTLRCPSVFMEKLKDKVVMWMVNNVNSVLTYTQPCNQAAIYGTVTVTLILSRELDGLKKSVR